MSSWTNPFIIRQIWLQRKDHCAFSIPRNTIGRSVRGSPNMALYENDMPTQPKSICMASRQNGQGERRFGDSVTPVSNSPRHCDHLCTDAVNHLENASKEDIMTFLEWMLDSHRRIRKRSTVHAYKRILFQVYRKSVGVDFNKEANEEINDVSLSPG